MNQQQLSVTYMAPRYQSNLVESYGVQCTAYLTKIGAIDYIGYMTDEEVVENINKSVGAIDTADTDFWTAWQELQISDLVENAVSQAQKALPLVDTPVRCFIFPWKGDKESVSIFDGVSAVAPHNSVIHLFIDPTHVSGHQPVIETVVHEYTHLYYYQTSSHHGEYTLYEHMLMEGIAEVFREEIVGGEPAPWAISLNKQEATAVMQNISAQLRGTEEEVWSPILFGRGDYKRWTGYSVGYHVVQQERANQSEDWPTLIDRLRTTQPTLRI